MQRKMEMQSKLSLMWLSVCFTNSWIVFPKMLLKISKAELASRIKNSDTNKNSRQALSTIAYWYKYINYKEEPRIYLNRPEQHFKGILLFRLLLRVRHYDRCLELLWNKISAQKINMTKIIDLAQHISTGANTEHCRLVLQTWFEKETFRLNWRRSKKFHTKHLKVTWVSSAPKRSSLDADSSNCSLRGD